MCFKKYEDQVLQKIHSKVGNSIMSKSCGICKKNGIFIGNKYNTVAMSLHLIHFILLAEPGKARGCSTNTFVID